MRHAKTCDCLNCRANRLLKASGFRFMSRGKPVAEILPERRTKRLEIGRGETGYVTPRIARAIPSKPLGIERVPFEREQVNYVVEKNGAVINGYVARHEDPTLAEITSKNFHKK